MFGWLQSSFVTSRCLSHICYSIGPPPIITYRFRCSTLADSTAPISVVLSSWFHRILVHPALPTLTCSLISRMYLAPFGTCALSRGALPSPILT
jgi:hypothetical protein